MTDKTRILVCVKCRMAGEEKDPDFSKRAGGRLYRDVATAAEGADDIEVVPVECFQVCNRPVTIGLAADAKWTWLVGDFGPGSAEEILAAARLYAASPDGATPKKERPDALKRAMLARLPPA